MVDLTVLKTEIDTDPLTRGYSGMDDAAVAVDINTFYRNGPADADALYNYCVQNKAKDDTAATPTNILGRLIRLSRTTDADVGTEFFLDDGTVGPSKNLTAAGADAGRTLLAFVTGGGIGGAFAIDLGDVDFVDILEEVRKTGCFKAGDKNAIEALSVNRQSRAMELGIVNIANASRVAQARALP